MSDSTKHCWPAWIVVAVIVAVGGLLGTQGWRAQLPDNDMTPYYDSLVDFRNGGPTPYRGNISSLGSFNPPGVSWLILPGFYMAGDLRAAEMPGAWVLYGLTVAGVFLLGRLVGGTTTGLVAAGLYGLSPLGLTSAGSLWPRYPMPCFAIWTCYMTLLWAQRRRGEFLVVGLLIWGVGLYVFPEIAPLILIMPAVWMWRRPPVSWKWMLAAAVLVILWLPYLRYEWSRDFADMRSLGLRQSVRPSNPERYWRDRSLLLLEYRDDHWWPRANSAQAGKEGGSRLAGQAVLRRLAALMRGVFHNFAFATSQPITGFVLSLPMLWALALAAAQWRRARGLLGNILKRPGLKPMWMAVGVTLLLAAAVGNPYLIQKYLGARFYFTMTSMTSAILYEVAMLAGGLLLMSVRLREHVTRLLPTSGDMGSLSTILLILVVPWLVLLMLEPERPDRVWLLWPMQAVVTAAAVLWFPRRLGWASFWSRSSAGVVAAGLLALVASNTTLYSKSASLARDGWAGRESPIQRILDTLAGQIRTSGVRSAVIGFQTPFARWEPSLLPSHERYKIGWDLDLYLRVHQGIENRCMCKEGFSTQDQWRVIASDSFQPRVPWTVRFDGADLNWGERVAEDSGLILSRAGARIHGYFSNPPP